MSFRLLDDRDTILFNKNYANGIKGILKGDAVSADDASPMVHEMAVKVRSKNLIDTSVCTIDTQTLNGVTVTNNGDGSYTVSGENTTGSFVTVPSKTKNVDEPEILPAGTYTAAKGVTVVIKDIFGGETNCEQTFTVEKPFYILRWYVYVTGQGVVGAGAYASLPYTFYPVCKYGNTAAEYTPYVAPTTVTVTADGVNYTPESDGTVNGIKSTALLSGITTDNVGATIECEYNKDANAVIEKLTNAIIALGGKV